MDKQCTRCGAFKKPWEFSADKRTGKLASQCRACKAETHPWQPSTTDKTRTAQDILRARFGGELPLGCVIPSRSVGTPPTVCRFYAECRALPVGAPVACEISDAELSIPLVPRLRESVAEPDYPWWVNE